MHYTAMSAAYFVRGDVTELPPTFFTTNNLAILIAVKYLIIQHVYQVIAFELSK